MGDPTSEVRDGMRIDWDVPIPVDDGLVLRADVYRPVPDGKRPVILTYGPYGKWLHFEDLYTDQWRRRSEEHTSELQSPCNLVCRLLLEKKKKNIQMLR